LLISGELKMGSSFYVGSMIYLSAKMTLLKELSKHLSKQLASLYMNVTQQQSKQCLPFEEPESN
jgi:hypothetical protein